MKFESSQMNLVELVFFIVQEMTISRYSLNGLRGIIGLNISNFKCIFNQENLLHFLPHTFRIFFRIGI